MNTDDEKKSDNLVASSFIRVHPCSSVANSLFFLRALRDSVVNRPMTDPLLSTLRKGVATPAMPLALTAQRKLDERRQRALARYYIAAGQTVDVSMGNANVIRQGDANAMSIAAFAHASTPPFVLNVAGPELLSVRALAPEFGRLLNKPVTITGTESGTALLNNGQLGHRLYGYPRVPLQQILHWTATWIQQGGQTLNKPTHFEARDGKF